MKSLPLAAALALLSPTIALAQDAATDINSHRYCNSNGADLRETGDGGYNVDLVFSFKGDSANAVYPAGGARLFEPGEELEPYVSINYEFLLDAAGTPQSRPAPVRVAVSTGRFAGQRLEPLNSLALRLDAGGVTSPPIELNEAYYNIALVGGDIGPSGSESPYDTELPQGDFEKLVAGFEKGERWIVLSQSGKEVARIPVPKRDYTAERDAKIAWVRKTVPLLANGMCG